VAAQLQADVVIPDTAANKKTCLVAIEANARRSQVPCASWLAGHSFITAEQP
jgi:hypothetical protein